MTTPKHSRRTPAEWLAALESQRRSGLTIDAYCKQHQITPSNFYAWRTKLNKQRQAPASQTPTAPSNDWLPLNLPAAKPSSSAWDIELALPGGVTLKMRSA